MGSVTDIIDEENDGGILFSVKFLRKKCGMKQTYFVYPDIEDVAVAAKDQIMTKVNVGDTRR